MIKYSINKTYIKYSILIILIIFELYLYNTLFNYFIYKLESIQYYIYNKIGYYWTISAVATIANSSAIISISIYYLLVGTWYKYLTRRICIYLYLVIFIAHLSIDVILNLTADWSILGKPTLRELYFMSIQPQIIIAPISILAAYVFYLIGKKGLGFRINV